MQPLTFFLSLFIAFASTEARLGSIKNGSCQNTLGVNPCGPGSACRIVDATHYKCEKQEIVEFSVVEETDKVVELKVAVCDQAFNPCGPYSRCVKTDNDYDCRSLPESADERHNAISR